MWFCFTKEKNDDGCLYSSVLVKYECRVALSVVSELCTLIRMPFVILVVEPIVVCIICSCCFGLWCWDLC